MEASAAAALLDEFKKLPNRIERPRTFMEIAGYPHYENVCSNFLAFFFDPEGPHGFGSLFLDALLDAVGVEGGEEGFGGNVSVEREVVTAAGNRIDLLIRSDSHAILIENKIFAAVANPFDDYAAYLDNLTNEAGVAYKNENKIKVLLELYPSGEGTDWAFRSVTHMAFATAVRSLLGYHVSEVDTRYLTLTLDFLNTLEHLGEGTRMDQRFVKLLAERSDEVHEFLEAIKAVRDELRSKAQELAGYLNVEDRLNFEQILWKPGTSLEHYVQHRIHFDAHSYAVVQVAVSPEGWQTQTFHRVAQATQGREELRHMLVNGGVPPENNPSVHPRKFAYSNEDLVSIAAVVQEELSRVVDVIEEIENRTFSPPS